MLYVEGKANAKSTAAGKGHSNKQSSVCLRTGSKLCDWTRKARAASWHETEEGCICENNTGCWNKPKLCNHQTTDFFLFIEYTKCVFRGSEQLLSKPRFGDYSFFHLAALPFLMSRQGQYVCLHGRLHMRGSSRPRSAWELCFHFIHFPWACTLLQGWPRNVVGLWSQEGDGADDAGPGGHVAEFRLYSQGTEESGAGMHLRWIHHHI